MAFTWNSTGDAHVVRPTKAQSTLSVLGGSLSSSEKKKKKKKKKTKKVRKASTKKRTSRLVASDVRGSRAPKKLTNKNPQFYGSKMSSGY